MKLPNVFCVGENNKKYFQERRRKKEKQEREMREPQL